MHKKGCVTVFSVAAFFAMVKTLERSIRRLEGVAKRTITPNLPKLMGDETETAAASAFMLSADTNNHNK